MKACLGIKAGAGEHLNIYKGPFLEVAIRHHFKRYSAVAAAHAHVIAFFYDDFCL